MQLQHSSLTRASRQAPAFDITIMLMYEVFSLLHASKCKSECYSQYYNRDLPAELYLSNQQWSLAASSPLQCCIQCPVILTMCSALLQVEPWSWSPHTLHIPDQAPVPIITITLGPQTSSCSHQFRIQYYILFHFLTTIYRNCKSNNKMQILHS